MTYLVTAASGHLGRLAVEALLADGIAPTHIVAGARSPEKVADLAARGVATVELDYDRPETISAALEAPCAAASKSSSSRCRCEVPIPSMESPRRVASLRTIARPRSRPTAEYFLSARKYKLQSRSPRNSKPLPFTAPICRPSDSRSSR